MESSNHSRLKDQFLTIKLKSYNRNRIEIFDYDKIFHQRRVLVFSLTHRAIAFAQLKKFDRSFDGIDQVYAINSNDPLLSPYVDKHSKNVIGLADQEGHFVSILARFYNIDKSIISLRRFWQYIVIINDGNIEMIWHNPYKENISWLHIKDQDFQYRKLEPEIVDQYLAQNK